MLSTITCSIVVAQSEELVESMQLTIIKELTQHFFHKGIGYFR